MQTVFVLGAGFSRAISEQMPLTDELGNVVRERVAEAAIRSPRGFKGGYFEAWLSRLAEPQPDLADHVNATNHGLFLRVTEELHAIMQERELDVLKGQPPWWLQRLVGLMHVSRSPVLTFNYDTLVERTVEYLSLGDWEVQHTQARTFNLVRNTPPSPRSPGFIVDPGADTFRLLKLHGSLDTYWVPGDVSGATVSRWDLAGTWGGPEPVDEEERRQVLPGRNPFIVPPAAAKSAFYNNPISRELWRSGAQALNAADRVVLVGYSLPPTDLVTSGMLVDALANGTTKVDVVNLQPNVVVERLIALGVPDHNIREVGGDDAVASYTDQLEQEAGLKAGELLKRTDTSRLLMIATSPHRAARVVGVEGRSDATYVHIEPITNAGTTTQVPRVPYQSSVTGSELLAVLAHSGGVIKVSYPDGAVATVVSVSEWHTNIGLGDGHWTVLVPSAVSAP